MSEVPISPDVTVGKTWKQYAAGAVDCIADSPDGRAARRIFLLAAGDLSPCLDSKGVNKPLTGLPINYMHEAHVQSFTCSVACIVYY